MKSIILNTHPRLCKHTHKHIQKIYFNKEDLVREIKELILSTNPGIEKFKDSFKIIYKCEKCNELHKNIVIKDDNMDKIIELSIQK